MGVSPGHAAVVTHPAVLLLVVAAAGLAGVHVAVQTLTFTVDQELEGLQAADAVRVGQLTLRTQQLSLRVLLLDFSLQITAKRKHTTRDVLGEIQRRFDYMSKCRSEGNPSVSVVRYRLAQNSSSSSSES